MTMLETIKIVIEKPNEYKVLKKLTHLQCFIFDVRADPVNEKICKKTTTLHPFICVQKNVSVF